MGKTNFTQVRPTSTFLALLFGAMFMLVGTSTVFGQEACNDQVNVTLDEKNCTAPLGYDAVLENPQDLNYYVKVAYPNDGHTLDEVVKCGVFKYVVYAVVGDADYGYANEDADRATKTSDIYPDVEVCWGYVNAEDKTPPYACIRKVVGLYKRPADYYTNADYFLTKKAAKEIDGYYYIYDPVTCDEDGCKDMIFNRSYLNDYNTNLLICTDVDSIYNVKQSYTDKKYAYYTGTPQLYDNCSEWAPVITDVKDYLVDYECGYKWDYCVRRLVSAVVYRTFYFEDEKGNKGEVTQEICFYKPHIYLPECKEVLDVCWYGNVDPNNTEVELAPAKIHSIPYYKNGACMTMYLDEHVCNVTATYEDLVLPGPEKCGFKVIRTWTILDWCWNPAIYFPTEASEPVELLRSDYDHCPRPQYSDWKNKSFTYEQHIIIGDDTDPVVACPDYYRDGKHSPIIVSTGPFDCESGFEVPAPKVTNKECAYTWTVEVWAYVPVLWHGVPTGEYELVRFAGAEIITDIDKDKWVTKSVKVVGVPKGRHYLVYKVEDHCGNTGYSEHCEFYVIDEIEPVAVCDDNLTVSVAAGRGGDSNPYGFARVYASDVDEGSWDNCSEILLQVRRFVPEECVADFKAGSTQALETKAVTIDKPGTLAHGKKGYWTVWAEYVDFVCCDIGVHPEAGKVLVELGVWDNANMSRDAKGDPIFKDNVYTEFGNYKLPFKQADNFNTCWLEVLIEDKIAPTCVAPHDIYLSCEEVPYYASLPETNVKWADLSTTEQDNIKRWFGEISEPAKGWDNCDVTVEMIDVIFEIHCKAGVITRQFQATDAWGRKSPVCEQKIYLSRHHDYCIIFPQDKDVECLNDPDIPGVRLEEYACDLLAVSTQDEYFFVPTSSEECYKLFRTYRVINWCQFDEDVDPGTPLFDRFDTYFDMEPLVVNRDEDEDGKPGDEDVYVRFYGWESDKDYKNELDRLYDEYGLTIGYEKYEEGTYGITYIDKNCNPYDYEHYDPTEGYWRYAHYSRGFYQYTQVIKVYDKVAPVVVITGETKFPSFAAVNKGDKAKAFKNGLPTVCVGDVELDVEITETCTPDNVGLKKIYLIPDKALGVGSSILLYDNDKTTEAGEGFAFEVTGEGSAFKLTGTFPIGVHELEIHGKDGCGNVDADFVTFEVFDAKAPAPICISGLSIELMPDGQGGGAMAVWANDFMASEIWDCSEPIFYTVHRADEVDSLEAAGEELVPGDDDHSITVTCDDPEVVLVYLYSWDAAGNGDRCEAMLLINDFMKLCDPVAGATVAGLISTEEAEALQGVAVQLSGQMSANMTTGNNGSYVFNNLTEGYDYTITPEKDVDYRNGVSTFDLIKISKHILGVEPLGSAYKMIAADVNNSKSITTLDLIQLRKLILAIDVEFSNNKSWRFVDASYKFPNAANPWAEQFPEVINFNDLAGSLVNSDFVAVKIGDVDGSAKVSDLFTEPREIAGVFTMDVKDQTLVAGNEYRVAFTAADLANIQGYQFTLNFTEEVEFVNVEYGVVKEENFGFAHLADRAITTSWDGKASNDVLFTLVVRANNNAQLSDVLKVGSRFTTAEAYNTSNDLLDVAISFNGAVATAAEFELFQNTPNPFKGETVIGFNLPEAANATVTIHDVTGKVIKSIRGDYARGYNQLIFTSNDLPAGVLYYTLKTEGFTATKSMSIIR